MMRAVRYLLHTHRKSLLLTLKLIFSVGALYAIYRQADWPKLIALFRHADILWIIAGFILLNLAQLLSALRQQFYLRTENIQTSNRYSIELYYLGMLFNHVLPGGVGGDGYKAYRLKKDMHMPLGQAIRMMLVNRANGMLWLVLIGIGFGAMSQNLPEIVPYSGLLLIAAAVSAILGYSILSRILFKERVEVQIKASPYSFGVQILVALCTACLFMALNEQYAWAADMKWADYLMLFMISSFVTVLPVSVGGVGLRELTFFYGGHFLGLNPEAGVAVAMLYFITNLCAALLGLIFFFKHKQEEQHGGTHHT